MPRTRLTPEERHERARLRALRWRRAHGIGPRERAQSPWQVLGHRAATYYRRRAKAREQAALAAREAVLDRLAWQLQSLRASLDRCAVAHAVMAAALRALPFAK